MQMTSSSASRDASSRPAVPLTVRVGFVGHRAIDDRAIRPALEAAFSLLSDVLQRLVASPTGVSTQETLGQACACLGQGAANHHLALFSGYAPGADRVAATTWHELRQADVNLGSSHCLLPFLDPEQPDDWAWTDHPRKGDLETRVDLRALEAGGFNAVTILDGVASLAELPARDPHLDQGRWIVRWSDAIVAIWNGLPATGTGGTADTVLLALRRGLPILWIDTSTADVVLRFVPPDEVWADTSPGEILGCLADLRQREQLAPRARCDDLVAALLAAFLPPDSEADRLARMSYATTDTFGMADRGTSAWPMGRACRSFARLLGVFIARQWATFMRGLAPAPSMARGVPPEVPALISLHSDHADAAASLFGNLHRGTQAAILLAAVLAVVLGTSPAVVHDLKHWVVPAEAALLGTVMIVWNLQYLATNHQRWSECRRLAERLRCLRATWPLGFDVADWRADQPRTWTEWHARLIRRAAGPPSGPRAASRVLADAGRVRTDPRGVVAGQAAYNAVTAERLRVLHHRLEFVETRAFWILLVSLILYAAWDWLSPWWKGEHHGPAATPVIGGLLLMMSAVVPTLCAACLALDSKLDIQQNHARTERLAREFAAIDAQLASSTSPAESIEIIRDASRLLLRDVDSWQDAAVRRKIAAL